MAFKIRDLMITVLPDTLDLDILDVLSPGPCDAGSSSPPGGTGPPGPGAFSFGQLVDTDELRILLQILLVQLGGPLSAEQMRARSLSDLDQLEEKLTTALEDVREMRSRYGGEAVSE